MVLFKNVFSLGYVLFLENIQGRKNNVKENSFFIFDFFIIDFIMKKKMSNIININ